MQDYIKRYLCQFYNVILQFVFIYPIIVSKVVNSQAYKHECSV